MSTSTDLSRIVSAMTERPWEVWTSNSFRRITAHGQQDGGVLSGTIQKHDRHPDLDGRNRDRDLDGICTLANHADALVALVEAVERYMRGVDPEGFSTRAEVDLHSALADALAAVHAVRSET